MFGAFAPGIFAQNTAAPNNEQPQTSQPPAPAVQTPGQVPRIAGDDFDREWSIEAFYWADWSHPDLKGGAAATDYETLDFPGRSSGIPGVQGNLALNANDYLRFSWFRMSGSGTTTSSQQLDLFGTEIPAAESLIAQYHLNVLKFSFEDLLWPYPKHDAKLSFKSLWEAQAAMIHSRIDAPYDLSSTDGYTSYPSATGERYVFLPTLGIAVRYLATKNIHLELRTSGFGIPHHADILDSQASAGRWIGRTEVSLGAKLYHWKTSPQNAEYVGGTIAGVFLGVRWGAPK
jgi:hypothetical protein